MSEETLKATVKLVAGIYDAAGYEVADAYLDTLALVWGEEVALEVSRGVWG